MIFCFFWQVFPTSFSVTADGQTLTLDSDYYLGANTSIFGNYNSITINNSTGLTKTATLDGAGHTVYFRYYGGTSNFNFTGDGVVLTVQNVSFQGYNPSAISYASANSKIIFGDNTKLVMDRDLSILYTDRTWTCSGNVLLDGKSLTLTASGENAVSMEGLNKTLTIKNTILKPQGPDSICCLDGASKIVLSNSTLEIGRDGLAVNNGSLDIDGRVQIKGIDISYTGTPSSALLLKRSQNLGFVPYTGNYVKFGVYSCGLLELFSYGTLYFSQLRSTKQDILGLTTSFNPYANSWSEVGGVKSTDIGSTDGTIWAVKTDRTANKVNYTYPLTFTLAPNITCDYVSVGDANYVFVLNSSTGIVYQCTNPTGAANSWSSVSGIYFPRSISAGSDGTLWFVSTDGRVYKKSYTSDKVEQVFDGIDRDIVKVSAAGDQDTNFVALLSSMPKDGRVLVSQSNGPFRDLGINKVIDVGIGQHGSINLAFEPTIVAENATYGLQVYTKNNLCNKSALLTMDRTLTFSSSGTITIKSGAELELSGDAAIRYQPNSAGEVNYNRRRHLVFQDFSSTLNFNRATLDCGLYGLTLTAGNMVFNGLNTIYTNTQTRSELEISSNFKISINSDANLNFCGPISYTDTDRIYPLGYFDVYGPTEATVKSGVTDPVSLNAISDAYAQGFVAPGRTSSDWLYTSVAVLDTSTSYTSDPEILTLRATDGAVSHIKLKDASKQTYSGGVVGHRSCDISVDGYFAYSDSAYNGYYHQSPRPLFNTAGKRTTPHLSPVTRGSFNYIFVANQDMYGIWSFDGWAANTWTQMPVITANVSVSTIDGTVDFQSLASWADGTLWRIDRPTGNLIKRTSGGTESTLALPSDLVGSVVALSAKQATVNYLAIASSTGQAFIKKDNDPWQNLGLSGVVKIAIGARGTIAILIKRDSVAHGTLFPLLVKPGL